MLRESDCETFLEGAEGKIIKRVNIDFPFSSHL
jgi:hypothetical protein